MIRDVAGYAGSPNIDAHAILWRTMASRLGHYMCRGINNLGQIVGTGTVAGDNLDHALMWTVDDGTGNTIPSATLKAKPTKIRVGGSVSVKASFTDPDNGPWNYTLNWGDGNSTTGDASIAGKISGISPHVYTQQRHFQRESLGDRRQGSDRHLKYEHDQSPMNLRLCVGG